MLLSFRTNDSVWGPTLLRGFSHRHNLIQIHQVGIILEKTIWDNCICLILTSRFKLWSCFSSKKLYIYHSSSSIFTYHKAGHCKFCFAASFDAFGFWRLGKKSGRLSTIFELTCADLFYSSVVRASSLYFVMLFKAYCYGSFMLYIRYFFHLKLFKWFSWFIIKTKEFNYFQ